MNADVRAEAIYELFVLATAWRLAQSGSMDWQGAKDRAAKLCPIIPGDTALSSIKPMSDAIANGLIVGEVK